jgi:hypothetical protein
VQHGRERDRHVSPELLDPGLVALGDRLDPVIEVLQASHQRVEHRLELGDPEGGLLVDPLDLLFPVRDQRLLERRRHVGAHLRDVALAVLLTFGLDAVLRERSRRFLGPDARQSDHHQASCFLSTEVSSSIRNFMLSRTVSSVA